MKKTLIATLMIFAFVTVGVLADPPANPTATDSFTVGATIEARNDMQVTVQDLNGATSWDNIDTYQGYGVSTPNPVLSPTTPIAYLSVISNRRTGYKISMKVEAMVDDGKYINYTVSLNGEDVTTNNGTAVTSTDIIEVSSLGGLTGVSYPIGLSINETQYNAAVEGSYVGTVTFNYTAN